ncbi:hypothetical protein GALL_537460 [mine drainage metagenome]|uniref:Uncharacterized protein n=1 Tax=mine drainage metagenome TaxID=410659 RepID=A0A1J5P0T3_9ZZZZ
MIGGHRFATAGQAVCDDQLPGLCRRQLLRQADQGQRVVATVLALAQPDRRHLGPHQGTVDGIKRQHQGRFVVTATAQYLVDEPVRKPRLAVRQQIGIGERDFAGDIDPAQFFIELDAVEHAHPLLDQHQIGQMQVTMALAHPATALPRRHQRRKLLQALLAPVLQRRQPAFHEILDLAGQSRAGGEFRA